MSIDPTRISHDIDTIAGFSEAPATVGHSRPTFSPAWRSAVDYVVAQAEAAGCVHRVDAAGNVFLRPASLDPQRPVWLSGSHLDSVPTGGKYDGVMGVVVPLEVLRGGPVPLELVIWAEEEGTTFGLGMIGSRLAVGAETAESVAAFRNRDGRNFLQAGAAFGVDLERIANSRFQPAGYRGLIEIHAEQGPALWTENIPLAVVTAIAGRKQYRLKLVGQPNHAGSTPMNYRRDALVAAARIITGVQDIAQQLGDGTVATVGKLDCEPNAINVIPGTVCLTVDLRSPEPAHLAEGHARLEDSWSRTAGWSSIWLTRKTSRWWSWTRA